MSSAARSRSTCSRSAGSARAKRSIASNFSWSRRSRHLGWYRYCLRPRWSMPVAWMWPPGYGQDGDLLAGGLALDEREDLLAVGVAVLARLEVPGERLDELLGDRQLLVGGLDLVGVGQVVEALRIDDLVGEEHRRHAEHVA